MAVKQNNLKIEDIPLLSQPHCKIKDKAKVERILNKLIEGGSANLQLISDFDHTLTKPNLENGSRVPTSFCIFEICPSLPSSFIEEAKKLRDKYYPIEVDPNLKIEDKVQYMKEWWSKSSKLLTGLSVTQNEIDAEVRKYQHAFRDGCQELIQSLSNLNVPVLVFSAGLGNVVVSFLEQSNLLLPNVKVISNFLQYENGVTNGLQEPLIHVFNKNEAVIKGTEYYELVRDRENVIVMGDSLGDAGMATGVPLSSNVLKIGFLSVHVEESLSEYQDTFDIVLTNDKTMDVPNALLSLIK